MMPDKDKIMPETSNSLLPWSNTSKKENGEDVSQKQSTLLLHQSYQTHYGEALAQAGAFALGSGMVVAQWKC